MSQSSGNPSGCQSESHDPDSGQARKNNPETTKDSLATKRKQEPSFTTSQGIDLWFTKIEDPGGHHEITDDHAQDDSDLSEGCKWTPLHELLEMVDDDDDGSYELEKLLDQWKDIIDTHSPNHQETALHMAIQKGFNKMARQLLEAGAEVNIENDGGESPLHVACDNGNQQLVEVLLEKGADPERVDASGNYPLHLAVVHGFEDTVIRRLFGPRGFVINRTVGGANRTPLNKAIYYGCEDAVDTLLEGEAKLSIRDSNGWTPLMTAIKKDQYDTFHKLLDHLKEHSQLQERSYLQERSPKLDVVIIPDNDGMTPLMQLSANKPGELVKRAIYDLCEMNPNFNATDNEGKTALHHAMAASTHWMETEPYTDVALKLIPLLSVKRLLHPSKDGETAFDVAFNKTKKNLIPGFEDLLNSLVGRLFQAGSGSIEELFCWAVYRLERHNFAQDLFKKRFSTGIPQDFKHDQWTILEWAIYARMPSVLLTCLRTLGLENRVTKDDKIDTNFSNCRALIEKLKEAGRKSPTVMAEGKRQKGDRGPTAGPDSDKDAHVLGDMQDILDYLYPEKAEKPTKPLDLSKPGEGMKSSLKSFQAAIIQSNFVKFRTIQEVLYDNAEMEHFQDIAEKLKRFEYTPNVSSEQASQTPDMNTKTSAQFTWIHLPSTNMVWMEDTAKKILKGEGCDKDEAEKVASFLRSSWIEIPDRTSPSRFMRPRYVVKKTEDAIQQHTEDETGLKDVSEQWSRQKGIRQLHDEQRENPSSNSNSHLNSDLQAVDSDQGETEQGKSFALSAIYMPYLYFSTYHQSESSKEVATDPIVGTGNPPDEEEKLQDEIRMRRELFNAYKNSVTHQPTTLDEFYYQFASDDDSLSDRDSRNKDQVVTKYLLGRDIKMQTCWPLLRVNQLWIWTIDGKWLITSTSCATHNIRDNLVADILEHLRRQVENGSRRFGPTSAAEMSRVIVDYCIGTYDRKRKRQTGGTPSSQGQHQLSTDNMSQSTIEDAKRKQERSIHQIFSDSINEIGRKESRLFSLSYRHNNDTGELETGLNADHSSKKMKALQNKLEKVAKLLRNIKDIRDELNILKSIAAFQHKVQLTMAGSGAKEELSSFYLLRDIEELEKFADKTQEAVKTTLTLQESGIANWQASQSFKQGRVVLVFTLVTVWFLPLSFLTSLFALDVGTFMEAPAWAFYIIFLVPLIFLVLAVGFVWKGDETWDYCAKLKKALVKSSDQEPKEGRSTARAVPSESVPRKRNGTDLERG